LPQERYLALVSHAVQIYPLGDQAIVVSFGNVTSPVIHDRVMALHQWVHSQNFPGVVDIVTAYSSLSICYDSAGLMRAGVESPFTFLKEKLQDAPWDDLQCASAPREVHEIPICYDPALAPDLSRFAKEKKMTIDELIALHTSTTYLVFMIGFLPGFPYLGEVKAELQASRHATPRQVVAGSVGLAGRQTGIYPTNSPGGWQIIGRTPLSMFRLDHDRPARLAAGDRVKFYSVSRSEFDRLNENQ